MKNSAASLKSAGVCFLSLALFTQANAFTPVSETQILPDQPESFAQFGTAIASSSETLVVGEPLAYNQGMPMAGAVSVYTRTSAGWVFETELRPLQPSMMACFGCAVAVDGDTIVVGAPTEDTGWGEGVVYVFQRTTSGWSAPTQLRPLDPSPGQLFGDQVAIEGDTMVIGAKGDDRPWLDAGAVYIFSATDGSWIQSARIQPAFPASGDAFGASVAIKDGWIAIGCPYRDTATVETGALFLLNQDSGTWDIESELHPSSASPAVHLGWSVALDGTTLAAGAPALEYNLTHTDQALLFVQGQSGWLQSAVLRADDPQASSQFGYQVGVLENLVVIGAPGDDTFAPSAGSVYAFEKRGTEWIQTLELGASDAAIGSQFGNALSLSEGMLAIGANYHTAEDQFYSGAAYAIAFEVEAPQNQAPIANASATITAASAPSNGQVEITLDGSLSADPNGDLLTFTWFQDDTLLGYGEQLVVPLPVGEHTIRLVVTDGTLQASATVTVVVEALNSPPVADAGATVSRLIAPVRKGAELVLNASQSVDADGDPLTYQWSFEGTVIGTTMTTSVRVGVGIHTFDLMVSDGKDVDEANCLVKVITPGAATWELSQHTVDSSLSRRTASLGVRLLRVAARLFDRGQTRVASRILHVYQSIIQRKPGKDADPDQVTMLVVEAQHIRDAVSGR